MSCAAWASWERGWSGRSGRWRRHQRSPQHQKPLGGDSYIKSVWHRAHTRCVVETSSQRSSGSCVFRPADLGDELYILNFPWVGKGGDQVGRGVAMVPPAHGHCPVIRMAGRKENWLPSCCRRLPHLNQTPSTRGWPP